MRTVIICTVGTSLFTNIRSHAKDKAGENVETSLFDSFNKKDWKSVADALLKMEPTARLVGAEINTLYAVCTRRRKDIDPRKLYLILSDTEDGRQTGTVLASYFESEEFRARANLNKNLSVVQVNVSGLQDVSPETFRQKGLRNLAREIIKAARESGGPEQCIIDATGGYKAQIAIGVLIGQTLGIPVYYKHERFDTIIDFPPLPVSFDFTLYEKYFSLFFDLSNRYDTFSWKEIADYFIPEPSNISKKSFSILANNADFQKFRVFLDTVGEGDETVFALNPVGEIYTEAALQKFGLDSVNYQEFLKPCPSEERKGVKMGDDHYPAGFKEYLESIFERYQWISRIITLSYERQTAIRHGNFYISKNANEGAQLVGEYKPKDFGARFWIIPYGNSQTVLHAALLCLKNAKH